jgi:hypothetical protein
MAINIKDLKFDEPIKSMDELKDKPGIYVILCKIDKKYYILDVGESEPVKSSIKNDDRKENWKKQVQTELSYVVMYTPDKNQAERNALEKQIRYHYNVPEGN